MTPTAMTIAGSDSSGGAGIQADLKTFHWLGVYGTCAVTALTSQNTQGVRSVFAVPASFVESQIQTVVEDIPIGAVKTGMLHRSEVIEAVRTAIEKYRILNLVVDPVMVATSGDSILDSGATSELVRLISVSTIVTPNIPEAEALLGRPISGTKDMELAAKDLLGLGCRAVLLKGGHLKGRQSPDFLLLQDPGGRQRSEWLESTRIETSNTHGTGCVLSAAITAYLSRGDVLECAVKKAKVFLEQRLELGRDRKIGRGHGPAIADNAFGL
jgi:hydroxymethylpyrimidine/phosphomethylpyrimidine kinase